MGSRLAYWVLRVIGFVIGAAIAASLEYVLLGILSQGFGMHIFPRGLGWIVLPIMAGFVGSWAILSAKEDMASRFTASSQKSRMFLASSVSWWLVVLAYVFMVEPFGGYWASDEWSILLKWLFIPPVLLVAISAIFRFAMKNDKAEAP
jgi:hypothetical protein